MKAISLWQPWASLIGIKRFETRSWGTSYRGDILIHAGGKRDCNGLEAYLDLKSRFPELRHLPDYKDLPFGAFVKKAKVIDCRLMTYELFASQADLEQALDNWSFDRYAWELDDVVDIEPIPFKGQQRIFNVPELIAVNSVLTPINSALISVNF
jgi:hypothetical protein